MHCTPVSVVVNGPGWRAGQREPHPGRMPGGTELGTQEGLREGWCGRTTDSKGTRPGGKGGDVGRARSLGPYRPSLV